MNKDILYIQFFIWYIIKQNKYCWKFGWCTQSFCLGMIEKRRKCPLFHLLKEILEFKNLFKYLNEWAGKGNNLPFWCKAEDLHEIYLRLTCWEGPLKVTKAPLDCRRLHSLKESDRPLQKFLLINLKDGLGNRFIFIEVHVLQESVNPKERKYLAFLPFLSSCLPYFPYGTRKVRK